MAVYLLFLFSEHAHFFINFTTQFLKYFYVGVTNCKFFPRNSFVQFLLKIELQKLNCVYIYSNIHF